MNVTIADIAEKAKVSRMTVSRVLSGNGYVAKATAEKIKRIMKELDYHPNLIARSLSSQKTKTIGVVIPKTEKLFLDNYIAQVLSGISDVAQEKDYKIMLVPVNQYDKTKGSYLNFVRCKLFDGLILLKAKIDDPNLQELIESGFPSIVVNYKKYSDKFNFVDSENIKGAELALEYLYKKGHKKIAFVAGSMDETNARDRLQGYKNFLKKNKLSYNKDYIINGEFNKGTAYEESRKLVALKNKPTAVFCSDDYMALGVIEQFKENGLLVPDDIAVMGFDNIEIGELYKPALTTVKQPMYEIGKSSFEALLSLINNQKKSPIRIILKTELVIRDSA
ncbi:MAG: LacI family DNA-binding transcriptional regulator [Ignavibacteria bacterium]|jgi:DNA-binding LacI/PurR family transcriptional regulator